MQADRAARLRQIAVEMDSIVREIGPKWIRLAHLRKEAQQIISEAESEEASDEGR